MALPTVVGVGAAISSLTTIAPAFPTSYTAVTDDVAITFLETESTDTVTPPSGWSSLINQVLASGTTSRLWTIWRRLVAGDTEPTIADAGDHMIGRMIVVRGCIATGNPWDSTATVTSTELVADTTVSIPTVTTTVNDCLILAAFGTGQDVISSAGATGWTNASLSSLTEQMDNWTTTGTGGGFAMASGGKVTAGVVSATTATLSLTANFKTLMTISLLPAPPGAAVEPSWSQRSPRPSESAQLFGPYSAPPAPSTISQGG